MVLDARLACEHLVSVGSEVEIMDHSLHIVGFSGNTSSPFAPYAYITFDTLLDIYFESGTSVAPEQAILLSPLLVKTEPGADIAAIKGQITERVERAWAFEPHKLGSEDAALGVRLLGPALKESLNKSPIFDKLLGDQVRASGWRVGDGSAEFRVAGVCGQEEDDQAGEVSGRDGSGGALGGGYLRSHRAALPEGGDGAPRMIG